MNEMRKEKDRMLFFTDLDHTLIYSHRHKPPGPLICAEELNGHPQSFITQKVYDYYKKQDWLEIIPLTSRTLTQYSRLEKIFLEFGWKDALICNGAILLEEGKEDPDWTRESLALSEQDHPAYEKAKRLAEDLAGKEAIVSVDPFFFYIKRSGMKAEGSKTEEKEKLIAAFMEEAAGEHLSILSDSRKIYCFPRSLNKGSAAERYRTRRGYGTYLAAGDSEFDIPMLEKAQIGLCPEHLGPFEARGQKRICRGVFSDSICEELEKIRGELFDRGD